MENKNMKNSVESFGNITKNPEDVIGAIRQEVYIMGANDYEIPALDDLLVRLRKGEIEPDEAIAQARAIKARKQDYH